MTSEVKPLPFGKKRVNAPKGHCGVGNQAPILRIVEDNVGNSSPKVACVVFLPDHWIIELQFFCVIYIKRGESFRSCFFLTLYPIGINLLFRNREYTHKGIISCQIGHVCPERV